MSFSFVQHMMRINERMTGLFRPLPRQPQARDACPNRARVGTDPDGCGLGLRAFTCPLILSHELDQRASLAKDILAKRVSAQPCADTKCSFAGSHLSVSLKMREERPSRIPRMRSQPVYSKGVDYRCSAASCSYLDFRNDSERLTLSAHGRLYQCAATL